jgi:hypothetical protein
MGALRVDFVNFRVIYRNLLVMKSFPPPVPPKQQLKLRE